MIGEATGFFLRISLRFIRGCLAGVGLFRSRVDDAADLGEVPIPLATSAKPSASFTVSLPGLFPACSVAALQSVPGPQ